MIETITQSDGAGATTFDEPVGIAFASNAKAYVALSSKNDIAVIDTASYAITSRVHVTAQEPRAIAVRDGLLYVAAFESGNQSEISFCGTLAGTGEVGDRTGHWQVEARVEEQVVEASGRSLAVGCDDHAVALREQVAQPIGEA